MTGAFGSPEAAALSSFPAKYCRVVASRLQGDDAYVLLDTGSDGHPYLYGVNCFRRDGDWYEAGSGNGPGWSQSGPDGLLGTLVMWDEAPPGADMVRVELGGEVAEETVNAGVYLVAWWRTPCPDASWPCVEAFRINGKWFEPVE